MARYRIAIALVALVVWVLITVWGIWTPHDIAPLTQGIAHAINWQIVGAGLFLLVLVAAMGWRDMGFNAPRPWSSLRLLWLPAIYLAVFLAGALAIGLPPPMTIMFLALNTAAVGLSEELVFRGVLFRALRSQLSLPRAIWITSALFGSIHLINAFTTGDMLGAAVQAITAFMSGVFFLALVLRTRSILPSIALHACWDFLLTTVASSPAMNNAPPPQHSAVTLLVPLLLILPNFLYALFLLRKAAAMEVTA